MFEALRFFRSNEIWIYLALSLATVIYLYRFVASWQEFRGSLFGLERENAQGRMNQSAAALVIVVLLIATEFVLVTFLAPAIPESNPLLTPTVDVLATPTTTLAPGAIENEVGAEGTVAPTSTPDARLGVCSTSVSEITAPAPDAQVSGVIDIWGSADIPNFGFYKLEVALADPGTNWRTIQAGRDRVVDDILVAGWDSTTLESGSYLLRLVVTDNNGLALPDCQVPIRIINSP
jgi:hypothetical protein